MVVLRPDVFQNLVERVANCGYCTDARDSHTLRIIGTDRNGRGLHAQDHAAVVAAEGIVILHEDVHFAIAKFIRHIVQIAIRSCLAEIQRRQYAVVRQCCQTGNQFHNPRCANVVAKVRFGGAHQQFIVVSKDLFHCQRFDTVIGFSTRTVRVDVVDLLRCDARICHCLVHDLHRTAGTRIWPGLMESIAGSGVREDLTINGRPTGYCMLILFQYDSARTFTNRHTGLTRERRTSVWMHDIQCVESGKGRQIDGLGTYCQHGFAFTILDVVKGHPHGVRAGGTRGRDQFNPTL